MSAEEAWDRLCVQLTGEFLFCPEYGRAFKFNGQLNYMYATCGDPGCCEDWWESREEFLEQFRESTFVVI